MERRIVYYTGSNRVFQQNLMGKQLEVKADNESFVLVGFCGDSRNSFIVPWDDLKVA